MSNREWLVLNVDDEPAIRYAKTRALQRAGFKVIEAESGNEGLKRVEEHQPDLVMCDVKLPDLSGHLVCRIIKERHPEILVLQVSASFVSPRDRATGLDYGADSYLTEPVEAEELVAAVRALLRMKKAEDDLRALNAKLESEVALRTRERDGIWKASSELMAVVGMDGCLKSVNPAWTTMLGYTEADLLGRHLGEILHPDDIQLGADAFEQLSAGRSLSHIEARFLCKTGEERWISWTATPEADIFYALGRDMTEDKRREAELEAAQEQLRQSQKMEAIGQLTGGIAHDFNNLLTGIIGGLDMIRRRIAAGKTEGTERFIEAATSSAYRAAALTHRLLAFSRRQSLDFKPTAVDALIDSIRDLLYRTLGENITLECVLSPDLWTANTDANQLEAALLNLAINARDAMPDGGKLAIRAVNIAVNRRILPPEDLKPGDFVLIQVTDTGTGMAKDVLEKAFDPFFTTKPIGQGTGLGLSMIYGFAKQSGGHVRILSKVGEGTTVELYLPRHHQTPAANQFEQDETVSAGSGEVVLLVEDDPSVRLLVTEVLKDLDYQAILASDGLEAVAILNSGERIDLVVTDVGLPGLNGRQVAEIGRQTRPALKILFVTGYAEAASVRKDFLEPGMSLITKPFDVNTLAGKLREMLDQ